MGSGRRQDPGAAPCGAQSPLRPLSCQPLPSWRSWCGGGTGCLPGGVFWGFVSAGAQPWSPPCRARGRRGGGAPLRPILLPRTLCSGRKDPRGQRDEDAFRILTQLPPQKKRSLRGKGAWPSGAEHPCAPSTSWWHPAAASHGTPRAPRSAGRPGKRVLSTPWPPGRLLQHPRGARKGAASAHPAATRCGVGEGGTRPRCFHAGGGGGKGGVHR